MHIVLVAIALETKIRESYVAMTDPNIPLAAPNIAPSNPSNDPLHELGLGSK